MDEHEKLAKAYYELGHIQAQGFQDGLNKEGNSSPVASRLRQRFGVGSDKEAAGLSALKGQADEAVNALRGYADDAYNAARGGVQSAKNKANDAVQGAQNAALGPNAGTQATKQQLRNRMLGIAGGAGAAGAGAGAAGGYAAANHNDKKTAGLGALKNYADDAFSAARSGAQSARNKASEGAKALQNKAQNAAQGAQNAALGPNGGTQATKQQLRNRMLGIAGGAGAAGAGAGAAGGYAAADKEGSASGNPMLSRL